MPTPEPLYDVLIYELTTRRVVRVIGTQMQRETGRSYADLLRVIAMAHLDDERYDVGIVTAGHTRVGDVLAEETRP